MSEFGPSYYGEVLAVSSRAVDEEEDEDDAPVESFSSCVVRWTPEIQSVLDAGEKIPCNVLVIAAGSVACGFMQIYYLHQGVERIGVVCTGLGSQTVNTLDQEAFSDRTCYIYRMKSEPNVIICQCNTQVLPEQAYSFVQQLFSAVNEVNTYVAVLSHKPVADYRCDVPSSQVQVPFLKALKTSYFQGTPISGYLEQPNLLDGLPAQVMSYCQVRGIAAVHYICYSENLYLDMISLKEFAKLTTVTPFKDFYQVNHEAVKEMQKLIEQESKLNTLYM